MKKFDLKALSKEQKETRKKILKLAHEENHSHIGSCLSGVDIIDAIYKIKKAKEKFILSNGHAGMALYAILQKYGKINNANLIKDFYIHPDRNLEADIHVSTGSLGHGLPIALGMAFADKQKNVYCMISDGECAEGSVWETLRITVDKKIHNLKIVLDANGWGGYDPVELETLKKRLEAFGMYIIEADGHNIKDLCAALETPSNNKPMLVFARTCVDQFPFLKGQDAHYYVMTNEDYSLALSLLE